MKYKLGECIEEIVDKTTENNQYEVLSVTKDGIYSQEKFFKKQIASEDNTGYKIIRKNNLVFSTMNLWMGSLDVLLNYEIGIVSPAYKIFKFDESKMIPSFGKYFMKSHFMLEQYKNCSEQGASVVRRNLDLKQLLDTEITIPTVEEQCKIVKVLENIDEIINKYTNLIKNKEQFIKSQFVEMFDKDNTIKKGKIIDACISIVRGPFGSSLKKEFFVPKGENTYKVYEQKNAIYEDHSLGEYYIDNEKFKQLRRFECKPNDIIMSCSGTVGKLYLLPKMMERGLINQALLKFTVDTNILSYNYFLNFMRTNIDKLDTKGTGLQNLGSVTFIKEMEIPIPNKKKQNDFDLLFQLIDKQKFHSRLKNIIKVKESEVYA